MPRPSKLLEKLEDYVEKKCGAWYARHKAKLPLYIPLGLAAWYFYGMFLNSLALGTAATFHASGDGEVHSIWVLNPFKNWLAVFTPHGLGVSAVIALLICLITKKATSGSPATSTPAIPGALTFCRTPPTVPPAF